MMVRAIVIGVLLGAFVGCSSEPPPAPKDPEDLKKTNERAKFIESQSKK